jgi:hypothetical protein
MQKPPIANFDSASAMLRMLARFLRGRDFARLGGTAPPLEALAPVVNALPRQVREQLYIWSGWAEASPPQHLVSIRAEDIAGWAVNRYPRRRYPAAMLGSSNGALVHLCAALGIPWLPQTVLIPVRRSGVHPDEPRQDCEWGREHAPPLLEANPEWQLHHMHDANQDRLMIQRMTYFRVKWRRLAAAYERFLENMLEPGATIFLVDCQLAWPTLQVAERHYFQMGAHGGATPEEYLDGSQRVEHYLRRYGSRRHRWLYPEPDAERPEAEWGFEPALREDVERLAWRRGYRVRRIAFDRPEDTSPMVADLYRWWYAERRLPANRLLVESFIVMEPYWSLRTGAVPFWTVFNVERSAEALEQYLGAREPFDEIGLMLFSHGVDSVGLASVERWRAALRRTRYRAVLLGVDERAYPRDFGVYVRYSAELRRQIVARYPLPGPLGLEQLDRFLQRTEGRYAVRWIDHEADSDAENMAGAAPRARQ